MNRGSTSVIKIALLIAGLCFIQSCNSESCNSQIERELSETEFFIQKKAFKLENTPKGWILSKGSNQEVIESRYAYKIEIDPNSEIILLNHRQLSLNSISEGLEKEFSVLTKRFEKDDIKSVPNVGFQIIYSTDAKNIDIEKISKTICAITKSVETIKNKPKDSLSIEKEKMSKLLQLRFSFFSKLN